MNNFLGIEILYFNIYCLYVHTYIEDNNDSIYQLYDLLVK